jgi:hypothetical protein
MTAFRRSGFGVTGQRSDYWAGTVQQLEVPRIGRHPSFGVLSPGYAGAGRSLRGPFLLALSGEGG